MKNDKPEFLKTTEIPKAGIESAELVYERKKVIGTPVKVMRTGKEEPDEGWHIAEVYFQNAKEKIDQPLVKVRKPDKAAPEMGLQKLVPLQILEKINPEIKFLIFERNKDYVLYEDEDHSFKIGLIIDINLEEESLLVMLGPEGDDITAPLDRIKIARLIDKSNNPKQLEKVFQDEVKKRRNASPDLELKPSKKRINERKNLVYYLKVNDTEANQPMGHAVNISNQGVMLIVSKPIEPESLFQLQIFLPEEIQGSRSFEFSAMSRWCQQDEDPDFYNVGFQFANISTEGVQLINRLIEEYCF
jgi:hypothetical protein